MPAMWFFSNAAVDFCQFINFSQNAIAHYFHVLQNKWSASDEKFPTPTTPKITGVNAVPFLRRRSHFPLNMGHSLSHPPLSPSSPAFFKFMRYSPGHFTLLSSPCPCPAGWLWVSNPATLVVCHERGARRNSKPSTGALRRGDRKSVG